jgi:hypothetical protein
VPPPKGTELPKHKVRITTFLGQFPKVSFALRRFANVFFQSMAIVQALSIIIKPLPSHIIHVKECTVD